MTVLILDQLFSPDELLSAQQQRIDAEHGQGAVSYTHLTLPTNREV